MDTIQKTEDFVFQTYLRQEKAFAKGEGVYLWDEDGKKYTDFLAGIAVCGLGHSHPEVAKAIYQQAQTLVHVSNLFYTGPQADLAKALCEKNFADRVFFANSGAEANEAAIKLARRYFQKQGIENRYKIITMKQSFHGRTMANLAATGQDKIKDGFFPMLEGFEYAKFNDIEDLARLMDDSVCAVMLEPVQGEGGVIPAKADYLAKVREFCTQKGVLLIFDEIQTGMGRCGTLFAHELYGVKPDIMTLAKALGNGIPIGAMLATQEAAKGFDYGSHGSTFGGTPLACAAALKVMELISDPSFLKKVNETAAYFLKKLKGLQDTHDSVVEIRGKGLLLGMEIKTGAPAIVKQMFEKGFIINGIQDNILRFVPPLIIEPAQIDSLVEALDELL